MEKAIPTICGVIGNPIEHSLSPDIHLNFAKQFALELDYQKYRLEKEQLGYFVKNFFEKGGGGLNVTLPFKQEVIGAVNQLTEASRICQSVNTLSIQENGNILGDTTDGEGLILHLNQLNYEFKDKTIMMLGAGGASISVIYSLLKNNSKIILQNRSSDKINKIISKFSSIGQINSFKQLGKEIKIDGFICAVSQFSPTLLDRIVPSLKADAFIYDLNYAERSVETLDYFRQKEFKRLSDGYGMLVAQAAKSFEIWHGKMPIF